jgi:GrpB-like predicted nucleotidyltransferase (UPF0157 family)
MNSQVQPVEIVSYDPDWPRAFAELRATLADKLGPLASRIEHVGSTAVPGLAAKPILDMNVILASDANLLPTIAALQELGYEHQGDKGIRGREAFRRQGNDVPRNGSGRVWATHHLYVCSAGNRELHRQIAFRDYLREHPEQGEAYGELKRLLAERFAYDRAGYSEAKTEFIVTILRQIAPDLA